MANYWESKSVVLLGGASLIGSHLAEALIEKNVRNLTIIDDLSVGKLQNIEHLYEDGMEFYQVDLRDYRSARFSVRSEDIVFHLASRHGGRGYVAGHRTNLWNNLELDTTIYRACMDMDVEKVIFSSSACAYPVWLQSNIDVDVPLSEDDINYEHFQTPDGPYGTEKLVSEMTLDDYVAEGAFAGVSTRSFTVYGPRIGETHAIGAFIAKTMIKQDPFEVWGSPKGIIRNWTHVKDNVQGALLAAEHMNRGAINIGIEDKLYPEDALEIIWDYVGWRPQEVVYKGDKPTGPVNRVSDSTKLKSLGWEPQYTFKEGLIDTLEWYYSTHKEEDVRKDFERKLTEVV